MAKRARLRSKMVCLLALAGLSSCQFAPDHTGPNRYVSVEKPGWKRFDGRLWLNDTLFNGWQYALYPSGDTAFVGAFEQGKPQGLHRQWYPNGKPKEVRNYRNGWQQGEQRGWYESGRAAFVYEFQNDVYEGRVREWYPNGKPARDGHYHQGQEEGLQRQWFAEGVLKANYVVRNGRTYGFAGTKSCVNVWDSISSKAGKKLSQ